MKNIRSLNSGCSSGTGSTGNCSLVTGVRVSARIYTSMVLSTVISNIPRIFHLRQWWRKENTTLVLPTGCLPTWIIVLRWQHRSMIKEIQADLKRLSATDSGIRQKEELWMVQARTGRTGKRTVSHSRSQEEGVYNEYWNPL